MKVCCLLALTATMCVACGPMSIGGRPASGYWDYDQIYGLYVPPEADVGPSTYTGEACQDDDTRLECRRSLHHYDEYERNTQSEIYDTGSSPFQESSEQLSGDRVD